MTVNYVTWNQARFSCQQFRLALVIQEHRTRMDVLVVEGSSLKLVKAPLDEKQFMLARDLGKSQLRKANASLRRLAKIAGTPKAVRAAVQKVLS